MERSSCRMETKKSPCHHSLCEWRQGDENGEGELSDLSIRKLLQLLYLFAGQTGNVGNQGGIQSFLFHSAGIG